MQRRSLPLAALAAVVACAASAPMAACAPLPTASSASTVLLSRDERSLLVTSPDDDALVTIDATTLVESARVDLPGAPEQLVRVDDRRVLVTFSEAAHVAIVDVERASVERVDVPCGGTRGAAIALVDGSAHAFVACPNDDRIVEVDVAAAAVVRVLRLDGAPSALAARGDLLWVTTSRGGGALTALSIAKLQTIDEDGAAHGAVRDAATAVVDTAPLATAAGEAGVAADALALDASTGAPLAAFVRAQHDGDRDRPASEGGYGRVVDGAPRIEPRLLSPCGGRYAVFDGGARAMSGPSALAFSPATSLLWVVNLYTDNVAVLRCAPGGTLDEASPARGIDVDDDALVPLVAAVRTGRAPRGIAVAADGRTAFIDVGFDHAVARVVVNPAGASEILQPALAVRRDVLATKLSDSAARGRALFHDAVDTHLTPSGVVTCASCHPRGEEDGLAWFLHTDDVARKLRRTPPAWGGRSSLAPLHWSGEFADAAGLAEGTTHALLEGDGLLVDFGALGAFMAEHAPPAARPIASDDVELVERGRAVFAAAGCAECHAGPLYADDLLHDVLAPSQDPDGDISSTSTPSLVAVRARAPYLHDGRARDLMAVLTTANVDDRHGVTSGLADDELRALIAYLESL